MKNLAISALFLLSTAALSCPIAKNLADVGENWELSLNSLHEQTVMYNSYNYVSSIDSKNQLTTIALGDNRAIKKDQKVKILFNESEIYREDGKAIDRSAKGVASINGELSEIFITMNDKQDKSITLGDFIENIKADFKVECKLKESVQFNDVEQEEEETQALQS